MNLFVAINEVNHTKFTEICYKTSTTNANTTGYRYRYIGISGSYAIIWAIAWWCWTPSVDNLKNLLIIVLHCLPEYFPQTSSWNLIFWIFPKTNRPTDWPTNRLTDRPTDITTNRSSDQKLKKNHSTCYMLHALHV